MTLQASGPISLSQIRAEFGGAAPDSLSEYYDADLGVPASGQIQLSDFYSKTAYRTFNDTSYNDFANWVPVPTSFRAPGISGLGNNFVSGTLRSPGSFNGLFFTDGGLGGATTECRMRGAGNQEWHRIYAWRPSARYRPGTTVNYQYSVRGDRSVSGTVVSDAWAIAGFLIAFTDGTYSSFFSPNPAGFQAANAFGNVTDSRNGSFVVPSVSSSKTVLYVVPYLEFDDGGAGSNDSTVFDFAVT